MTKSNQKSKPSLTPIDVFAVSVFGGLQRNQSLFMELGLGRRVRKLNEITRRAAKDDSGALEALARDGEALILDLRERTQLALKEESVAATEFPDPAEDQVPRQQRAATAYRDCSDMLQRFYDAFAGEEKQPTDSVKLTVVTDDTDKEIGIESDERADVVRALTQFLASTYSLYVKSLFYHWNVAGPQFQSLHTLFQAHYEDLHQAGDEIAERVRALGFFTPGSLREFERLSSVEGDETLPGDAGAMVESLERDHQICSREARSVMKLAAEAEDEVTADMMVSRMKFHDKAAWMLGCSR